MKDPIAELLRLKAYAELGILPVTRPHHDADRDMADLTPEERRKMKRKFRKLWRRLTETDESPFSKHLGRGDAWPSRKLRRYRKAAVDLHVVRQHVAPALKALRGEE